MKRSNTLSLSLLITISMFFTGCYTQFSSIDRYSDSNRNSKYYSWNDEELSEAGYYWDDEEQTAKPYSYSSQTLEEENVLAEESGLTTKIMTLRNGIRIIISRAFIGMDMMRVSMMDMKKDTMMGMTIVIGSMEDIIQI